MQILDWLRDGFFNSRARYRRTDSVRRVKPEKEAREDPSGRHDFGRRAHHPDPRGHYEFGSDPVHRMVRPHQRQL
jgi:hypothetical protein